MKIVSKCIALATALILVFSIAGCSSNTTSDTTSPETNTNATGSPDSGTSTVTEVKGSEELQAELAQYVEVDDNYSVEGATEIDAKAIMEGKKLFILPGNYTVKFSQTTCDYIKSICDSMGIEATIFPTDGTTGKWVEGMEAAINQGYSAILCFSGVTMEEITPQVMAASDAGIPVIDLHFHDFSDYQNCTATYCLPANYTEFGRALALYAINACGPDANYLMVTSDDLTASLAMENGINSAFNDYAPNANVSKISVVCPDWSTKIQSEVQNALIANPDIDYIITCFDSTLLYVTAGIEGAGKTGEVLCNGYNGTPDILDMVKSGSVDADLGESLELMAYCCLDQTFRILSGSEPLPDENPPMYFWDSSNIDNALDSTGKAGFGGYDDSYIEYYENLWGLTNS